MALLKIDSNEDNVTAMCDALVQLFEAADTYRIDQETVRTAIGALSKGATVQATITGCSFSGA